MAYTRSTYDPCTETINNTMSKSIFDYTMDPNKYYNCHQARAEFGIYGGNDVSLISGDMVNFESNLKGLNQRVSKCGVTSSTPPECIGCEDMDNTGLPCNANTCQLPKFRHLRTFKMIEAPHKINNIGYVPNIQKCETNQYVTQVPQNRTYSTVNRHNSSYANPVTWK